MEVNLGDKVRDRVTGLEGIVVAKTEWLNGCVRVVVQTRLDKDGKVPDGYNVDVEQLEVLEKDVMQRKEAPTGGPMPSPARHPAPQR
jgi:hypothetical protein